MSLNKQCATIFYENQLTSPQVLNFELVHTSSDIWGGGVFYNMCLNYVPSILSYKRRVSSLRCKHFRLSLTSAVQ